MTEQLADIWVYLAARPLLSLTLTLIAYQAGLWASRKAGMHPLANPVLIAVILLVAMLAGTGTPYQTYFEGAQFVHFLLGPATVALALPLYRQIERVKTSALAIAASLIAGTLTAILTAVGTAWLLGASEATLVSIAPKSVTAPVAMGISEQLGGLPSLTAVLVILTGILGAAVGPLVLNLVRVKDWAARGFALGTASHGIGTARALQVNELAGAFAGLAMGLNALATSLLLPLLWRLLF
ncbi:LrgB family protein [Rhizobiales bacterium]|uniref:LrgB family protein n=1 Tax=Hongsoonwoonella zoysiae TaxID=2821844 RepID=UPI001561772B|nr:LrgB family protein [Hongsoonwoonella zoysiae]NRG18092.1 LrgB family protein [Hongsoonwoonella zoysiae]